MNRSVRSREVLLLDLPLNAHHSFSLLDLFPHIAIKPFPARFFTREALPH